MICGLGIPCEIKLRWMSSDVTHDKVALVKVMAWCRQATVGTTPAFRHSRNWRYLVTTQVASFDDISSQETWHAAFPSLGNFIGLASLTQQEESDYLPSLTTHHQRACSTTSQGALCLSHKLYRKNTWLLVHQLPWDQLVGDGYGKAGLGCGERLSCLKGKASSRGCLGVPQGATQPSSQQGCQNPDNGGPDGWPCSRQAGPVAPNMVIFEILGFVSLTFREFFKVISQKYSMPEFTIMVKILC